MHTIPDTLPCPAFVYDGSHGTFRFNSLAAAWFGVDNPALPRVRSDLSFDVCESKAQFVIPQEKTPWRRALTGERILDTELELHTPSQAPRTLLCSASPLKDGNGTPWGALVTLTDITTERLESRQHAQDVKHLRMILEGTNAGTWEWNIQTGECRFNERWAQIVGYTLDELDPMSVDTWLALVHPQDLANSRTVLQKHFAGEQPHYDLVGRMRHKDGHWVWVHARGRVYQWDEDGAPLRMAGTHLDISGIHQAEEEVRASQAYMQALINSSSDVAIIATDTTGLITVFNTGAEKLLGYAASEMVGKKTPEVFHLESEVIARGEELTAETGQDIHGFEVFVHAARHGRSETRHWTYITRFGEHRTVSLSASALTDGRGNIIGFLGMAVDETAQIQAEEKARLAAERFAGAFDSTAVGMALVSLEGRWMEVNGALCEMLGYSEEELLRTDFQTLTHPDDLQNDLALLQQLLANKIPNYDMLKRYFRKNGELIRAKLWVSLVRDSHGAPLHFVSQIQNITDEYLARQALQSSEARLRGLFDLSPLGIGLMDYKTARILEANDALIAPSGYTRDEFMRLTDRELTPREYAPAVRNAIEQIRSSGRYMPFEKEYIRKDGSRYPRHGAGHSHERPFGPSGSVVTGGRYQRAQTPRPHQERICLHRQSRAAHTAHVNFRRIVAGRFGSARRGQRRRTGNAEHCRQEQRTPDAARQRSARYGQTFGWQDGHQDAAG